MDIILKILFFDVRISNIKVNKKRLKKAVLSPDKKIITSVIIKSKKININDFFVLKK